MNLLQSTSSCCWSSATPSSLGFDRAWSWPTAVLDMLLGVFDSLGAVSLGRFHKFSADMALVGWRVVTCVPCAACDSLVWLNWCLTESSKPGQSILFGKSKKKVVHLVELFIICRSHFQWRAKVFLKVLAGATPTALVLSQRFKMESLPLLPVCDTVSADFVAHSSSSGPGATECASAETNLSNHQVNRQFAQVFYWCI